uniref:Uncharacterized protein n=1 Tax=Zea mays TaxID=4577 RepID=C4J183_MAIZE|nr:unknown [Zea mays]
MLQRGVKSTCFMIHLQCQHTLFQFQGAPYFIFLSSSSCLHVSLWVSKSLSYFNCKSSFSALSFS